MKASSVSVLTATLLLTVSLSGLSAADAAKPKYTIEQVMEALHKGKTNVGKTVASGQGTKEDFAKLVEYYESLPLCKPEKGDQASWETKSKALLASAKALKDGAPDALEAYKKAVNCKACHNVHRKD
jgi:cytochrome c553